MMTIGSDSTQEMVTKVYLPTAMLEISEDAIQIFALDAHTIGLSNFPSRIMDESVVMGKSCLNNQR